MSLSKKKLSRTLYISQRYKKKLCSADSVDKVFRSHRNEERDGAGGTLGSNVFHARAPATGNEQRTGVWQEP